jgi:hypothetical protein
MYVLFDLHWLDDRTPFGLNRDGSINRVPPLPDGKSAQALRTLAARFRNRPEVLYEIFNEPHTPIADVLRMERNDPAVPMIPGADGSLEPCDPGPVTMAHWHAWAPALVRAIREAHPAATIFVPGVEWAYDLRGMPLDPAPCYPGRSPSGPGGDAGVVYTTHVYAGHRRKSRSGWFPWSVPGWDEAFGDLASVAPVFVSELGGTADDLAWGEELLAYLDARQIGWTAWSWSDRPRLVRDAQAGDYTPTPFGELVRAALLRERE